MATTVEDVYDDIRVRHARGHTMDDQLPRLCQQALHWIERNRNLNHMRHFRLFTVTPGEQLYEIDNPDPTFCVAFKAVGRVGWVNADGAFLEIKREYELATHEGGTGLPRVYGVRDRKLFWPKTPDKAYGGLLLTFWYTKWPTSRSSTHPILAYADDVIINHVLMQLAPQLRNPTLMSMAKTLRDDALATLNLAQDEIEKTGPQFMEYAGQDPSLFDPVIE